MTQADKADPAAIMYGWKAVHDIASTLKCEYVAATTGNHDADSRFAYNKFDARGTLQGLVPPYPVRDDESNDRYWARNFVVIDHDERYRLVVLNSSAYHGHGDEYEHGRVSDATLAHLQAQLSILKPKAANLLLCHHHPQSHMELGLGEKDIMKNGQLLLDTLADSKVGQWLVVHGHKHHPKLTYASGTGASPTVFAAGSFSARLRGQMANSFARNQFYIVTIPLDRIDDLGLVGSIRSWEWSSGIGWIRSRPQSQLPYLSGFGCREPIVKVAKQVAAALVRDKPKRKLAKVAWKQIQSSVPVVEFLLPRDFGGLQEELRGKHGLSIVFGEDGLPTEIGRPQ